MIGENIQKLRRAAGWSQETLAEKLNVSRQTVAKWESGDSSPDLATAARLADIFGVSLDRLADVRHDGGEYPPGKYLFGAVHVGDWGQIILPERCREVFGLEPGSLLLVVGDLDRGIALTKLGDDLSLLPEDEI